MSLILPVPQKTWLTATVANVLTGTDIGNQKDIQIRVKNQRKLWPGQGVLGSGDGTTGGCDGIDRWLTTANVPNGGAWYGAKNGNGSQDVVLYTNSGQSNWLFVHSPGGLFTGGTASARPTATDEKVIYGPGGTTNSFFGRGGGGSTPQFVCNMMCSTDGLCLRLFYWQGNINFRNVFFDAVDEPTPGWALPNYGVCDNNLGFDAFVNQNTGLVDHWMNEFNGGGSGIFQSARGPAGAMQMTATLEGTGTGNSSGITKPWSDVVVRKNAISNTYRFLPRFGMFSVTNDGNYGWHGRVFDMWAVPHGLFAAGSTTPLAGNKEFFITGDLMFPWNGTAYRTA